MIRQQFAIVSDQGLAEGSVLTADHLNKEM